MMRVAAVVFLSPVLFFVLVVAGLLSPAHAFAQRAVVDWRTPAELSEYRTTPTYDETMEYVRRVAEAAPKQVKVEVFGKTPEGRDLVDVVLSRDGEFDPAKLHAQNRPVVLIQNAIHAGEMDGKDACLALMRDIVVTRDKAALLERAVIVIIPIYNADGHERRSPYNRINQNGPEEMGWRTTSTNLNLNRDYMKADAPETRAWLKLWNRWLPDFFVDDHVTDGADFQYDVTLSIERGPNVFPAQAAWIKDTLLPGVIQGVDATGKHLATDYIEMIDGSDPAKGIALFQNTPRFSTGYTVLQNRPGMLVEMHMLKDYRTRVTGNYEALRGMVEIVNRDADKLVKMNRDADAATVSGIGCNSASNLTPSANRGRCEAILRLDVTSSTEPFVFKTYRYTRTPSEVSGGTWIQYSKEPMEITVPRQNELKPTLSIVPPHAYIIPAQWTSVIDVIQAHGLRTQRTTKEWTGDVDVYRCNTPQWQQRSFEGHHLVSWAKLNDSNRACKLSREKMTFPAGSVVVPLDQRAAQVAIHLLEPQAEDSLIQWGFFDTIFEQKEYGDPRVLEKLAREMMARDPKLKAEFEQRVASDKEFAANPYARLQWFYFRSPWKDTELGRYPVGRLTNPLSGLPVK
jgi:murein tripeptide amidase MpaA